MRERGGIRERDVEIWSERGGESDGKRDEVRKTERSKEGESDGK